MHNLFVQVEAAGEGVQVGQIGRPDNGNPFVKALGVVLARSKERSEAVDNPAVSIISGQAAMSSRHSSRWLSLRFPGRVSMSLASGAERSAASRPRPGPG